MDNTNKQLESAGRYDGVRVTITTSGNVHIYLVHNNAQIVPGALYRRPMQNTHVLRDYIERNKYVVKEIVWEE